MLAVIAEPEGAAKNLFIGLDRYYNMCGVKYTWASNTSSILVCCICMWGVIAGCRDAFEPMINAPATGYLVIEGFINSSVGRTTIQLSRTGQFAQNGPGPEARASVEIIGEKSNSYALKEKQPGIYESDLLNLTDQSCRLKIKTFDGKVYQSDLISRVETPEIDSVSWRRTSDGLRISVNTHDDSNRSKYYKWTFEETWEVRSVFTSLYKFVTKIDPVTKKPIIEAVERQPGEEKLLFFCWKSNVFDGLMLGSTAKLSRSVITQPVTFIPAESEQLGVLYSIEVEQIALDEKGYEFFNKLKTDTELSGSIFNRQPTELKGNFQCITNPAESVIGYVGFSSKKRKRIFISEVEAQWNYAVLCEIPFTILPVSDTLKKYSDRYTPLYMEPETQTTPQLLFVAGKRCVDCTSRNASNVRPVFWPN
ncbi:MAG: DUF4249 domain-containing protein [Sphingobacteriaceae bacterium]|nr:DUF4249 domain-containing protein [Sphingobacteriaceae bacterium]